MAIKPILNISDVTVTEGDNSDVYANFTVTLSGNIHGTAKVYYTTADGTALTGSDYTPVNGTLVFHEDYKNMLTFNQGEMSQTQTIQVPITGDFFSEPLEYFLVNLIDPANADIGDGEGIGTIIDNDQDPTISIDNVSVIEGDTGTTNAVFTVTLSSPSEKPITVDYASADDTASSGSDYDAVNGTLVFNVVEPRPSNIDVLTFSPGETSKTIEVPVKGDTVVELDERFFVNLSNAVNATIADSQGIGTIIDDDTHSTISIDNVSVTEGDAGITNAVFTVKLSSPSEGTVKVDYATADDTAVADSDYTPVSGTLIFDGGEMYGALTFSPGETSKTIEVPVKGDTVIELDERFFVNLSNAVNATLVDSQGIGTIIDDDQIHPTISIGDVSMSEGNTGTTNAVFVVTLSAASIETIRVDYGTANDTANSDSDYDTVNGTLVFNPGETTKAINVPVQGDTGIEPDERFFVNLSNPANATIADNQGIGIIIDDDGLPTISIGDISVTEGNKGTTNAVFTVKLSTASAEKITVDYGTANDTASLDSDYTAVSGTLTFNPGQTSKTINVAVQGDTGSEADERFFVNLSNPVNANIADSQAIGTIIDDDHHPIISIGDVSIIEGNTGTNNAVLVVTLSAASGETIKVDYATASDTASSGIDYNAVNGTLVFNPGETTKAINVPVKGDMAIEPNERFLVNLSNPSNATIADNQGIGIIIDDDTHPIISIGDVSMIEGNIDTRDAVFVVTLSAASGDTISVDYASADDTASSGSDYDAVNGTLVFNPGETTKAINVPVKGDMAIEPDERFFVNLSNAANAVIADSQGIGIIVNDDAQFLPTISIADIVVSEEQGGITNAAFVVTLSAASSDTISVDYATADDTASSGSDYDAVNGTLVFNPGETSKTINVPVIGDSTIDPGESFFVNLSNAHNATIVDNQGQATILDSGVSGPDSLINPVYRFSNQNVPGTHFYTASEQERQSVLANYPEFAYDGIAFLVGIEPQDNLLPVYRFCNQNVPGTHFYTASEIERQTVLDNYPGFNYEGIAYYVHDLGSNLGTDVYRFSNQTVPGTYFYTASMAEYQNVLANYPQFNYEGMAYEVNIL